jgi:hypothetical protein
MTDDDTLNVLSQVLSPEDAAELKEKFDIANSKGNCEGMSIEEVVNAFTKDNFGKSPIDNKERFKQARQYQKQYAQMIVEKTFQYAKDNLGVSCDEKSVSWEDAQVIKNHEQPIKDYMQSVQTEYEHRLLEADTGKKLDRKTSQYKRPSFLVNLLHANTLGNQHAFYKIKKQLLACADTNNQDANCAVTNSLRYEDQPNWYDDDQTLQQRAHATVFMRKPRKSIPAQSKCLYMEPNGLRVRGECDEVVNKALEHIKNTYIDDSDRKIVDVVQNTYTMKKI